MISQQYNDHTVDKHNDKHNDTIANKYDTNSLNLSYNVITKNDT